MQVLSLESTFGSLLIPVSTVAQIVSRVGEQPIDHQLPFVRSKIDWQGLDVPVVASSEMLGDVSGADAGFLRAVVLWPMLGSKSTELFALSSLSSPNVVNFENDGVSASTDMEVQGNKFVLSSFTLEGGPGLIPDLGLISRNIFRFEEN